VTYSEVSSSNNISLKVTVAAQLSEVGTYQEL
jgi:hypothetical protein